jgi:hypothetical protein
MLEQKILINNTKQYFPHAVYQYVTAFFKGFEDQDPQLMANIEL